MRHEAEDDAVRWYWIDRFIEFESGKRAKAIKNITLAEDHLHDHFVGNPTMPHSLVIEGMAQTGGLLVGEYNGFREKVVLAKLSKIAFHRTAGPGDSLIYTADVEYIKEDGAMVSVTSHMGDELHAEGQLMFAHLNDMFANKRLFHLEDYARMMRMLGAYDVGRTADGKPLLEP